MSGPSRTPSPHPQTPSHFPPLITLAATTASDSSGCLLCGARAGPEHQNPGAQLAEGRRESARPAPSAGQRAQSAARRRQETVSLELCPRARQPARTGSAPPLPRSRSGPPPRLSPLGRATRGWGAGPPSGGRGEQETTVPSRSCVGAVEAAGRVGLLGASPVVRGLSLTQRHCRIEVAE